MYSVLPEAPVKPVRTPGTRPDTEKSHAKKKTKQRDRRKKLKKLNRKTTVVWQPSTQKVSIESIAPQ
jgi:hypothetical protein